MNEQLKNNIAIVLAKLMDIHVKGSDSMQMADCIIGLQQSMDMLNQEEKTDEKHEK